MILSGGGIIEPAGVIERGMRAEGWARNLGDLSTPRRIFPVKLGGEPGDQKLLVESGDVSLRPFSTQKTEKPRGIGRQGTTGGGRDGKTGVVVSSYYRR